MDPNSGGQNGPRNNDSNNANLVPQRIEHTYSYIDKGPYIVIVERLQQNIDYLHPIALGEKLKQNNVKNILAIQKKGNNRVAIEFTVHNYANEFLSNNILRSENLKAYIPASLAFCKGISRHREKNCLYRS